MSETRVAKKQQEPAGCEVCGLRECFFVPGYGPGTAEIVIVGEAPGSKEVEKRRPFVGEAGKLLNRALREAGINRDEVYITNTCLCRPWPHRAPKPDEVRACRPRLIAEVRERRPRVVLALGSVAMRALLPGKVSIQQEHGTVHWSDELGCDVIPAIHPAAILRSPGRYRFQDLAQAVRRAVGNDLLPADEVDGLFETVLYHNYADLFRDGGLCRVFNDAKGPYEVFLDVETASDGGLLAIGISCEPRRVHVLTEEAVRDPGVLGWLNDAFSCPWVKLVGHNLKYDVQVLWRHGVESAKIDGDTMLMSYTLDERQGVHGLKVICRSRFQAPDWEAPVKGFYKDGLEHCPRDVLYQYNATDVYYTNALYSRLDMEIGEDERKVLQELLIPADNALARMESTGILVDREEIARQDAALSAEIAAIKRAMCDMAGRDFNPDSPKQLCNLLYRDLDLPVPGRLSTDEDALTAIAEYHPLPGLILKYRKAKKLHSTYIEGLLDAADAEGRVHTTFNLHGTVTGRLSSSHPNVQNVPRADTDGGRVRNLFIATPGYVLVQGDLSQAEVRVLAYFSQDKALMEAMAHQDIHTRTASLMFKLPPEGVTKAQRTAAKRLTFGLIYGMSVRSLARDLGIGEAEADGLVEQFFSIFRQAREWIEDTRQAALRDRFVRTPFGRKRRFDVITDQNKSEVLRQAVNTPIQSVASDLTLRALVRLDYIFAHWPGTRLLLTVHDSILAETRDSADAVATTIKSVMEDAPEWLNVPLVADVEIGQKWGALWKWDEGGAASAVS